MSDKNQEDSWRQLALEIVATLSETASAMLRKQTKFLPAIITIILQLMCELEEEDDWSVQDEVSSYWSIIWGASGVIQYILKKVYFSNICVA